jgi:hypothetical protein
MTNTLREENYKLLIDSLENLAKKYEDQVSSYPGFVDVFDEVISDFTEAFLLLPNIMEERMLSYEAVREIIICRNMIALNLASEQLQTDESFELHASWNLLRQHAAAALAMIEKA